MCIAIVKKAGAEISDKALENCFDNNKDGAGIAYAKEGKLHYVKGIFDKKKFIKAVRQAEKEAEGAMLIHCRIGTSGLMDKNNCHPHIVNNNVMLIHNGVLRVDVPKGSKVSDTVIYIEKYLKDLPKDFMKNEAICKLIEENIGSYNKFALLNNKGEYKIINEKAGHWVKDVWYSNDSYSYNKNYLFKQEDCVYWNPKNAKQIYKIYTNGQQTKLPFVPDKSIQTITTVEMPETKRAFPAFDSEKAKKQIQQLSNMEIMEMGEYPVYDMYKQRFVIDADLTTKDGQRYRYLDDIDEYCYEEYMYEIQLRGLINEISDDELEEYEAGMKYRV